MVDGLWFWAGRRFTGIKSCGGGRLAIGDGELSEELLAAAYVGGALRVRGCQRGCGGMCRGEFGPLRAEKTATSCGGEVAVKVCGH